MSVEHDIDVACEVPGLKLRHIVTTVLKVNDAPVDGEWAVVHVESDRRVHQAPFRTLHAAAHYATRIAALTDWTASKDAVTAAANARGEDRRHAEAHAHEVDAVYRAGSHIEFENGPGIVDDDGLTRAFLAGAPALEVEEDEDGAWTCKVCSEPVGRQW